MTDIALPRPLLVVDLLTLMQMAESCRRDPLIGALVELVPLIRQYEPRAVLFYDDQQAARIRMLPHHKHVDSANRLKDALVIAPKAVEAFGWFHRNAAVCDIEDLLYSVSVAESRPGGNTLIVTRDRALYPAVSRTTKLILMSTFGPTVVDLAYVRKHQGISPQHMTAFMMLAGDRSVSEAIGYAPELAKEARNLNLYKQLTQLKRLDVAPPPDRETDWEEGIYYLNALGYNTKTLSQRIKRRPSALKWR